MAAGKLIWDQIGERFFETGVSKGVLYELDENNEYSSGVAWSGLSAVTESPSGAEASPIYADNIKYLNLYSAEEFGATVEAYYSPDEFDKYDGTADIVPGVSIGQQTRKAFGLSYVTQIGNDTKGNDYGYKIHIIYGAQAAPSERSYNTINDSPEANTLSWELTTTPVNVTGFKPTATVVIDSTKFTSTEAKAKLTAFEDILYGKDADTTEGTAATTPRLPFPDEIATLLGAAG